MSSFISTASSGNAQLISKTEITHNSTKDADVEYISILSLVEEANAEYTMLKSAD